MKSFKVTASDNAEEDKFLGYMAPSIDEVDPSILVNQLKWLLVINFNITFPVLLQLSKDMYDENEDISFSWVREYHYDVWAVLLSINTIGFY